MLHVNGRYTSCSGTVGHLSLLFFQNSPPSCAIGKFVDAYSWYASSNFPKVREECQFDMQVNLTEYSVTQLVLRLSPCPTLRVLYVKCGERCSGRVFRAECQLYCSDSGSTYTYLECGAVP